MHYGDQRHAGLCFGWRTCTNRRREQGRSQRITRNASDLHNARATILNLFYNMIKKICQNNTLTEAAIPCKNLTPNLHKAIVQPLSTSAMTWQSHWNLWIGASNTTLFRHVQGLNHGCLTALISRIIRLNCFSKMWSVLLSRTYTNK